MSTVTSWRRVEVLTVALALAISAGAAYEAAIALGWISLGPLPGDEAAYQWLVLPATALAILLATLLALGSSRNRFVAALPLPAAAFMVARFYGYDPYYTPTLRRASDGGMFSPSWVWAVALVALAAAVLALVRRRLGVVCVPALLLCLFTALFVQGGH